MATLLIPGVGLVEATTTLLIPGAGLVKQEAAASSGEVSATPLQQLFDSFGPALAARLNGVLQ